MLEAQGIGSDGPSKDTVTKLLDRMGQAGIDRLEASDALIHRGRREPRPEDFQPPPPPDGPAAKLHTVSPGYSFYTYEAEDSIEALVRTTENSPLKLQRCVQHGLRFHIGWLGVPMGWHHAVQLMRLGEVSAFDLDVSAAWGEVGGSFETLLVGPRPSAGTRVTIELELIRRAEGFFPGNLSPDQAIPARFWIRRGEGAHSPELLDQVSIRLRAWQLPVDGLEVDFPHISRGETLLDTQASGISLSFIIGDDGSMCDIMERVILNMRCGDHSCIFLAAGVLSVPGALGDMAPAELHGLSKACASSLEFEISDLSFEVSADPKELLPQALMTKVQRFREEGNVRAQRGLSQKAIIWYDKVLQVLDSSRWFEKVEVGDELHNTFKKIQLATFTNLALCHLRADPPESRKAIECCSKALDIDPQHTKALFRKGKALAAIGEHASAEELLKKAAGLEPSDAAIREELEVVRKAVLKAKKSEAASLGCMFDKLTGLGTNGRVPAPTPNNDKSIGLYSLVKNIEENPYAGSDDARHEAVTLQNMGRLEIAIWAWEAATANAQQSLDFPTCWFCWFNLGRLYMDLTSDKTALLCFERFVSVGDLPTPPLALLRHVHLLRAFCALGMDISPENKLSAIQASLGWWLRCGDANAESSPEDALQSRLEDALSCDDAMAIDAEIALGLLTLAGGGPSSITIKHVARAILLPERCDSLFGDPNRQAPKWNFLGSLLMTNRPEHALVAFSKALRAQPFYSRALRNLGVVLFTLGRLKEAVTAFAVALKSMPALHTGALWEILSKFVQHPDLISLKLDDAVHCKDVGLLSESIGFKDMDASELPSRLHLVAVPDDARDTLALIGI